MAIIVNDLYSTITDAGVQAIIAAGAAGGGPQINITGFQIGALSAADGATPDPTATSVGNLVYTGNVNQIFYAAEPNSNSCIFRIVLDETVGNFTIGQIALFTGTTMFSLSILYQPLSKWKQNLPSLQGNSLAFDLILGISNAQSCINLTLLQSLDATLPEVQDETYLPTPGTSIYDTYLCDNNTTTGVPALASRRGTSWWLRAMRAVGGQGETVLAVNPSLFDSSVGINMAVYFDYTRGKFFPADPSVSWKFPIGVATSSYEVVQTGFIKRYATNDIWPATLTPEEVYCVKVGAPGVPGPLPTYSVYGMAVDNDTMYIDMADKLGPSYLAQMSMTTSIGGVPATALNEVNLAVQADRGIKSISTVNQSNATVTTVESTLGDGSRVLLV